MTLAGSCFECGMGMQVGEAVKDERVSIRQHTTAHVRHLSTAPPLSPGSATANRGCARRARTAARSSSFPTRCTPMRHAADTCAACGMGETRVPLPPCRTAWLYEETETCRRRATDMHQKTKHKAETCAGHLRHRRQTCAYADVCERMRTYADVC
jgi:hypothetical protein